MQTIEEIKTNRKTNMKSELTKTNKLIYNLLIKEYFKYNTIVIYNNILNNLLNSLYIK